jgi:Family of unknown function (DUF6247)
MMPVPTTPHGDQPLSAIAPRDIRSALIGSEVADFDSEYRRTMAEAAESLDLSPVLSMLMRWQRVALSTRDNPDAHRHMLATAARLNAGEAIATESWQETKARLGL